MTSSQHRQVACAILIDTFGRFLLQQRDDIPGILHPGKVGLFGGHREGKESYLECVVREIQEEISYYVPPGYFKHLISYDGLDVDVHGGRLHGEFFVATDIPVDMLRITEGSLLVVKREDVIAVEPKFAPTARFAMNILLNKQ
jgi:8-oxo-dGTP diphosphatase